MSQISKSMTGIPWHAEKMTRAEGDERRHTHRCRYFEKEKRWCKYRLITCPGAAHCDYYKEGKEMATEVTPREVKSNNYEEEKQQTPDSVLYAYIGMVVWNERNKRGVVTEVNSKFFYVDFDNGRKHIQFQHQIIKNTKFMRILQE